MIYLDNAATTLKKPQEVIDAVVDAMMTAGNGARGTHPEAIASERIVYDARRKLASLFGFSHPERLSFTSNATEALNTAIAGVLKPDDHVITTVLEHNSVLRPLYRLRDEGIISLSIVPADEQGNLCYGQIPGMIRENTRLMAVTQASNLTGNGVEIEKVRSLLPEDILLLVDASQSAGTLDIRMDDWGIDILCFTGHKGLMGPQGTGGILVRPGVDVRPLKVGGSGIDSYNEHHPERMPARLEAGTLNTHGIAGLLAGAAWLEKTGIDAVHAKEMKLLHRFVDGLRNIDGITLYGDFSTDRRAPIVSVNLRDFGSDEVSDLLSEDFGIATRPGAHCAPLMHRSLGTQNQGAVRFSFSAMNTEDEVDEALRALRTLSDASH